MAASGVDALRACKEQNEPIMLALVDVVMPDMDGPELVRCLRELYADVHVIFMSGYPREMFIDRLGIHNDLADKSSYISKPFRPNELLKRIQTELTRDGHYRYPFERLILAQRFLWAAAIRSRRPRGTLQFPVDMRDVTLPRFGCGDGRGRSSVVFGLDASLRVSYCNAAWDRFASENAGTAAIRSSNVLRKPVLDFIAGPLRGFYEFAFKRVLSTGEPWKHKYECSSASFFRQFTMEVLPMKEPSGLMIVNSLLVLRPHSEPTLPAKISLYDSTKSRGFQY